MHTFNSLRLLLAVCKSTRFRTGWIWKIQLIIDWKISSKSGDKVGIMAELGVLAAYSGKWHRTRTAL